MAATSYSPIPTELEDPVTYKEASALLAKTGHPASVSTITRWVREANHLQDVIPVVRVGRTDYVSWTAILREHRRRTTARLRSEAGRS